MKETRTSDGTDGEKRTREAEWTTCLTCGCHFNADCWITCPDCDARRRAEANAYAVDWVS